MLFKTYSTLCTYKVAIAVNPFPPPFLSTILAFGLTKATVVRTWKESAKEIPNLEKKPFPRLPAFYLRRSRQSRERKVFFSSSSSSSPCDNFSFSHVQFFGVWKWKTLSQEGCEKANTVYITVYWFVKKGRLLFDESICRKKVFQTLPNDEFFFPSYPAIWRKKESKVYNLFYWSNISTTKFYINC